jgi:F-type H+-transporting ATPase subunit alpha
MPLESASTGLSVNLETDKLNQAVDVCVSRLQAHVQSLRPVETGTVTSVSRGVVRLSGLPGIASEELVRFPHEQFGLVRGKFLTYRSAMN